MIAPDGCRFCGCLKHGHLRRWSPAAGFHVYVAPFDAQRQSRERAARQAREVTSDAG